MSSDQQACSDNISATVFSHGVSRHAVSRHVPCFKDSETSNSEYVLCLDISLVSTFVCLVSALQSNFHVLPRCSVVIDTSLPFIPRQSHECVFVTLAMNASSLRSEHTCCPSAAAAPRHVNEHLSHNTEYMSCYVINGADSGNVIDIQRDTRRLYCMCLARKRLCLMPRLRPRTAAAERQQRVGVHSHVR